MKSLFVTPENWLEWRNGGIGGSDAPPIMNCSPWTTAAELLAIKTGQVEAPKPTFVMRRGLRMESPARKAYEKLTGIPMPKRYLESKTHPFMLGSYDGLNTEAKLALEIKCPGRVDHLRALTGQIPKKYIWQCVHLGLLSGFDVHYYSYNPKYPAAAPILLKRDPRLEEILLEEESRFWQEILKFFRRQSLQSKEFVMSNEPKVPSSKPPMYTAKEVVEVLTKAAEFAVILRDILSEFNLPEPPVATQPLATPSEVPDPTPQARARWEFPVRRGPSAPPAEALHTCARCHTPDLEDWMTLCSICYQGTRPRYETPPRRSFGYSGRRGFRRRY